ncbi:IL-1R/TLR signaling inhibitor [Deerpox virus W-1170-84]|uniref:IL-1R/TLR signaling inhibitor n=1 Tax=Deerpox virus (strain W-1170-84) TaxID=305676 RepID=Q08F29_DPV84|nr:IL-1R/TLR signaling inhibitor [Deerpox virus W-1170-84]
MANYINFNVSILTDKIVINVDNTNLPVIVFTGSEIQYKSRCSNNFILRDSITDDDDIMSILKNYLWYRGFIGLGNMRYGRVFKELRSFDNDAVSKYGSVDKIFSILNLNSEDGVKNFKNFMKLQKDILSKNIDVYSCIEIIGLCAMVAEQWKRNKNCLNWSAVVDEMLKIIHPNLEQIKYLLQDRLVYEELF